MPSHCCRIIAFCLITSYGAHAQDLLSIYQAARQSDPTWLAAIATHQAAQEATRQSQSQFLPFVDLSAQSDRHNRDIQNGSTKQQTYNSNSWSLNIKQSIFNPINKATHQQAKASVQQANALLTTQEHDLIIRSSQAYFAILSAETQLRSVQAEQKAIAQQLEQVKRRFEVGLVAITDVNEAKASYDLVKAKKLSSENNLLLARDALSEITGAQHPKLSPLQTVIDLAHPEPQQLSSWIELADQQNPSLQAMQFALEQARTHVQIKRAGHLPYLDLVASHTRNRSQADNTPDTTKNNLLGIRFKLPLYAGGRVNSQTRQALAELEQAQYNLQKTQRAIHRQTRTAYLSVLNEISRIKALQQAVISAQTALQATEAGFDVGTRTIVDVLNAQRLLYSAQNDYAQTRHAYLVSSLRLKQAAGILSQDDVAALNQMLSR